MTVWVISGLTVVKIACEPLLVIKSQARKAKVQKLLQFFREMSANGNLLAFLSACKLIPFL